ncbi:MAG TPA: class I SAM-dependent methyltransferase [Desulfobacterales bacterium]|nr:class I SAM-dependent methyltransferase [Desulfobacterales bacterium]
MTHHHRGKSSESFLDKDIILRELNILPGQTVLDAGCGNGYMSKEFSRILINTGRVFALDPDREAIEALRKQTEGTNIEAMIGDITSTTPLEASSIDLIYLSTVFHGFSESQIRGFQTETRRLLKPHGRLSVVEIQKSAPFGPPLEMRFSPEELKRIVTLAPLTTLDVGHYFYMQLFRNSVEDPTDKEG